MRTPRTESSGFTLLEMLVVVFIIGLVSAALTLPNWRRSGLDPATTILVSKLRYTAQRATSTGAVHRLTLDLEGQSFRIESQEIRESETDKLPGTASLVDLGPPRDTAEFTPVPTTDGQWTQLDLSDVRIAFVRVGDQQTEDEVGYVGFAAEGGADPAEIRLVDEEGFGRTIRVIAFTGEIVALEPTNDGN